jgi:hypothetical protein
VANTLYGFLSPFCPQARCIARERKAAGRGGKKRGDGP